MFRWILNLVCMVLQRDESSGLIGNPLPPTIPPEAHAMLRHHNARCGGVGNPPEVTVPPLRGSLRDRMQREKR